MGTESVEIILTAEESFQIKIEDKEAEKLETVGTLYELVLEKLRRSPAKRRVCLSAHTFYRLRRSLVKYLGSNERIKPSTGIKTLIKPSQRRNVWRNLEKETGLKMPVLAMSWLGSILVFFWLVSIPVSLFTNNGWLVVASITALFPLSWFLKWYEDTCSGP